MGKNYPQRHARQDDGPDLSTLFKWAIILSVVWQTYVGYKVLQNLPNTPLTPGDKHG